MTAVLMLGSGRQEGGRDPHVFYIHARFSPFFVTFVEFAVGGQSDQNPRSEGSVFPLLCPGR